MAGKAGTERASGQSGLGCHAPFKIPGVPGSDVSERGGFNADGAAVMRSRAVRGLISIMFEGSRCWSCRSLPLS